MKTPHEIFDGSDAEELPPERTTVIMGRDCLAVEYVRADIAEQAAAKERAEILEMIEKISMDWDVMGDRQKVYACDYLSTQIKQRGECGK